jgi:outer membrane lipoprotein SlyB
MLIRNIFQMLAVLMLVAACAQSPSLGESSVRYGRVAQVDNVMIDSEAYLGIGAIIGGVAGGVLGHQFSAGSGRDVATVAGALFGTAAGAATQKKLEKQPGQHIIVTLTNGVAVGITQPSGDLHVGDQVRIEGSGNDARVIRY